MPNSSTPNSATHRNSDQIALRFPPGQRATVKAMAAANRRTMNAELLVLIERGMHGNDALLPPVINIIHEPITVDELFDAAFNVPRDPRSAEYKAGARAALNFRIIGARIKCPYAASTAQDDAYHAGIAEGHAIWRKAMAKIADGSAS